MPDSRPARDHDEAVTGATRDARIEQLLVDGLDRYFAGAFEDAISLWTRVLFLDRTHDRARAYIDRARAAQAERQREAEALLHEGVRALQNGHVEAARGLVTTAIERGAPTDLALGVLGRIDRLQVPASVTAAGVSASTPATPTSAAAAPRPLRPRVGALAAAALVPVAALAGWWLGVGNVPSAATGTTATVARPLPVRDAAPVPPHGELALARARRLQREGRWFEALRALDGIGPADAAMPDADALRAALQAALLVSAGMAPPREVPDEPAVAERTSER